MTDTEVEVPTQVTPVRPRGRARAEEAVPQYFDMCLTAEEKKDTSIISLHDSEDIPPVGQAFGVNGRFFTLRPNAWYRVPTYLLATIDNAIVDRPIKDNNNRFIGTRPMKRFPYELFRG